MFEVVVKHVGVDGVVNVYAIESFSDADDSAEVLARAIDNGYEDAEIVEVE